MSICVLGFGRVSGLCRPGGSHPPGSIRACISQCRKVRRYIARSGIAQSSYSVSVRNTLDVPRDQRIHTTRHGQRFAKLICSAIRSVCSTWNNFSRECQRMKSITLTAILGITTLVIIARYASHAIQRALHEISLSVSADSYMQETRQLLVKMTEREYEWLRQYGEQHHFSVQGALRAAIRTHNMLHMTPGALEAVAVLQPRWPLMALDDVL